MRVFLLVGFVWAVLAAGAVRAQDAPVDVAGCELKEHPEKYDGKVVRVRGTLSVAFEDCGLLVPGCANGQSIWLAFGGDVPGIVASTANDNYRRPGSTLKINGRAFAVEKDEGFRRLYALISARRGDQAMYQATATLTGGFFAGEPTKLADGRNIYAGYGHLDCCSLLVITRVEHVTSSPEAKLELRGVVEGPDGKPMAGVTVVNDTTGGWPPVRQEANTNERGEFQFSNSGLLLRIKDPWHRPIALVVTPDGKPVRVRLQDAKRSDWVVPACETGEASKRRIGFSILFETPAGMDSQRMDEPEARSYFIFPRGKDPVAAELFVLSAGDALPEPSDEFVESKRAEERWIKDGAGQTIGIDVRGRYKLGGAWRKALLFGREVATYSIRSGEPRGKLDRVIDSACVASR